MSRIVSIIGGGWSFSEVDHSKVPGLVIGVNDALMYFTGALSYIVSMDRLWAEARWDEMERRRINAHIRRSVLKNVGLTPRDWLFPFDNSNDGRAMCDQPHTLNGQNSGACAVNLAYASKPINELYLFGFDMCAGPHGEGHWHPPYPWTAQHGVKGATKPGHFRDWSKHFARYAKQFYEIDTRVFNVSTRSLIESFDKVSPQEVGCAK